jgi:hypothetical protein
MTATQNVRPDIETPAAAPAIAPDLIVAGALQAVAFYERAFGARAGQPREEIEQAVLQMGA